MSRPPRLAGVVGWPVAHSLSPKIHRFWLQEHGIQGAYVPLAVRNEDFAVALNGLRTSGFAGINVTVPHKEAAFAVAHALDEPATAAGAANLLLFENGQFIGRNTDVEGLQRALADTLGEDALKSEAILVLGAGGAARAAVLACGRMGAADIRILARNNDRVQAMMRALSPHVRAKLTSSVWGDLGVAAEGTVLLVNATSAGMKGGVPLDLDIGMLPKAAAVCDIVYSPRETELLKIAKARGHRTIDGLGMLMHQAVPAFQAFYGSRPTVTAALRQVLEGELGADG